MFSELQIENFRGLEHITVDNLKRICLISGRNNVGKSSLLEALFLFMDHVSSDVIRKINFFRGNLSTDFFSALEPLFFNMDLSRKLSISVKENERISKLSFEKDNNYLPHSSNGISEDIIAQFRSATKESYSLQFQFSDGDYSESGHFFSNGDSILRQIESNLPGNEIRVPKPTQFINSALTRSFDNVIDTIGELELSSQKKIIIDILQELDPDIEDIVTISKQNISQLHIRINGKWFPLQYAGDGVMKLLHICLGIIKRTNGLMLIDELESGFHYSMYGNLWRIIDKISFQSNCQVIATTHSYELIAAVHENLESKDDFRYYRLGKNNNTATSYYFDYDMLSKALDFDLEVR